MWGGLDVQIIEPEAEELTTIMEAFALYATLALSKIETVTKLH